MKLVLQGKMIFFEHFICDLPSENQPSSHLVVYFKKYRFEIFSYKSQTSALYCAYVLSSKMLSYLLVFIIAITFSVSDG